MAKAAKAANSAIAIQDLYRKVKVGSLRKTPLGFWRINPKRGGY